MRRALISVFDKTGLDTLAKGLASLDWELVASGGTADAIRELGLDVTRIEHLTDFPEMLGGRVKTLHPRIHAGILARREVETDLAALDEHGIELFDLVCVNLYPFEQVAREHGVREEEAVEMIDIGGPSMLRGAAKNFAHVAPVCRPADYEPVLTELRASGELSHETRRRLAATAFATSASYEAAIASWFAGREAFPPVYTPVFEKHLDLAYGENPHQSAAYYAERGVRTHLLARVEQLHGRELSFNNLNDLDAARMLVREFALPACVIVKHANPCGVAVGASIEEAYEVALAADPLSAYGGIVALNRAVGAALGERLAEQFLEVLFAPGYVRGRARSADPEAVDQDPQRHRTAAGPRRGSTTTSESSADCSCRTATGTSRTEKAWRSRPESRRRRSGATSSSPARVCKHVASNAIVIAKDLQTIGIGAGQMSRVDAVRIALEKAHEHGHSLHGRPHSRRTRSSPSPMGRGWRSRRASTPGPARRLEA